VPDPTVNAQLAHRAAAARRLLRELDSEGRVLLSYVWPPDVLLTDEEEAALAPAREAVAEEAAFGSFLDEVVISL
jgi:hypothetical protein